MSSGADFYEIYFAAEKADDEELIENDATCGGSRTDWGALLMLNRSRQRISSRERSGRRPLVGHGLPSALKKASVFDAVVNVLKIWIEAGNRRQKPKIKTQRSPQASARHLARARRLRP